MGKPSPHPTELCIKKLEKAVLQADFDLIMSLLEEVKQVNETYYEELHQLVENFEYENLLQLLRKE